MPEYGFSPEDENDEITGIGADIFVRKKKPGHAVGVGYFVDVYENGIKVDSIEAKTKKDVKKILDEYKGKYNTQRSFEIESQQHVTYTTKEERGEDTPKSRVDEKIVQPKEPKIIQEQGATAMHAFDQLLLKKASIVENLLNHLKDPTPPIKKRAEAPMNSPVAMGTPPPPAPTGTPSSGTSDVEKENVDFIPETPSEEKLTAESAIELEKKIADSLVKKIITYINENPQEPVDRLYNTIKKFNSSVKKSIKNWEKTSGEVLNVTSIATRVKSVVNSGNVEMIKKMSGMDVTPDVAAKIQEVTLKEIGSQLDQGSLMDIDKAAAVSAPDAIKKIIDITAVAPENEATFSAAEAIKNAFGDKIPENIIEMLPDTFSGQSVATALQQIESGLSGTEQSVGSTSAGPTVEIQIKAFWKYVQTTHKTATLERFFEDWVNSQNIELNEARQVFAAVAEEIDDLFFDKLAVVHSAPLFDITIINPDGDYYFMGQVAFEKGMFDRPVLMPTGPLDANTGKILDYTIDVAEAFDHKIKGYTTQKPTKKVRYTDEEELNTTMSEIQKKIQEFAPVIVPNMTVRFEPDMTSYAAVTQRKK